MIEVVSCHAEGEVGDVIIGGVDGKPIHLMPMKDRLLALKLTEGVRVLWGDGVVFRGGRGCKPVT